MVSILERFQGESKLQVKNCRKFVILRVIVMKGPQIWFVITRVHCTLVHFTEKIYTEPKGPGSLVLYTWKFVTSGVRYTGMPLYMQGYSDVVHK